MKAYLKKWKEVIKMRIYNDLNKNQNLNIKSLESASGLLKC